MIKIFFVILCLTALFQGIAQDNFAKGRIVYEQIIDTRVQYLEMWFSPSLYMYTRKFRMGDHPALQEKIRYTNAEDSIKAVQRMETRKNLLREESMQIWYGKMSDSIVKYTLSSDSKYCVADTMKFLKWQIREDTLRINGILCQMAVTTTSHGDKLIAWFASNIPISAAPYALRGLPGLLLQVQYESGLGAIKMLELEWPVKGTVNIAVPPDLHIISKAEHQKMVDERNAEGVKLLEYYRKKMEEQKN